MFSETPGLLQQPRPFTWLTTGETTREAEVSQRGVVGGLKAFPGGELLGGLWEGGGLRGWREKRGVS